MDNSAFGKDKIKKLIYLLLIFGAFAVLHNFVPQGLDQVGWDGFLVLFVAVFLWLTEWRLPLSLSSSSAHGSDLRQKKRFWPASPELVPFSCWAL